MSITSEITRIKNNVASAYQACEEKGVTFLEEKNIDNLAGCISLIQSGTSLFYVPREVFNGSYGYPINNFNFVLPENITSIGDYALYCAFYGCTSLTAVSLPNVTSIGANALGSAFYKCTSLTSVSLPNIISIGDYGLINAFEGCSSLTTIDFSNLTTIAYRSLYYAFWGCTSLTSISFPSLTNFTDTKGLEYAFYGCTALKSISFPSLNSNSFSVSTSQFGRMLYDVTGCTVHFPSNLETVLGDVTSGGFGGTNTTVLFDLPATE